jgi:hypothetical protein
VADATVTFEARLANGERESAGSLRGARHVVARCE